MFTLDFIEETERKQIAKMAESQNAPKKTFDFKIAGVPYKLKTSHGEETVNELVDFVNGKITEALSVTKNSSFQNAAVFLYYQNTLLGW